MSDATLEAQVVAARAYESLLVPALFREWAPRVLEAVGAPDRSSLLDVACGTGIVAREAYRADENRRVVGVDIAPGMLAVANEIEPDIEWSEGPAESLPFPDSTFDAVVSQFGLMFFRDRVGAVREMHRVLAPGGAIAVAVWDRAESMEVEHTMIELLGDRAGPAAADALRAPFALGDVEEVESLFVRAGATNVTIETKTGTACFPSVRSMVDADLRGWLPLMGVVLSEKTIESIHEDAERALGHYVRSSGELVFRTSVHIATGGPSTDEDWREP